MSPGAPHWLERSARGAAGLLYSESLRETQEREWLPHAFMWE